MTDLISSLADSIVALINASPRSPTKAEIEDVLLKCHALLAVRVRKPDAEEMGWAQAEARKLGLINDCQAEAPTNYREQLVASLVNDAISHPNLFDKQKVADHIVSVYDSMGRHDEGVRIALSIGAVPSALKTKLGDACQGETSSVSQAMLDARDAIRKSSYEPGRRQHMLPCPRVKEHPDAEHRWHAYDNNGLFCEPGEPWDMSNGSRLCICGARKP